MRRTPLLLATCLTLLGLLPPAAPAASKAPRCRTPTGGEVVLRGSRVTMWRTPNSVRACHRVTGRSRALWTWGSNDQGYGHMPARYASHGDLAALAAVYWDKYGANDILLFVLDVRRGTVVHRISLYQLHDPFWISGFVLAPSGATALAFGRAGSPHQVVAFPPRFAGESAILGHPDANPRLRVASRTEVEWSEGGALRRAAMPSG